jgi:hypothetical protein
VQGVGEAAQRCKTSGLIKRPILNGVEKKFSKIGRPDVLSDVSRMIAEPRWC